MLGFLAVYTHIRLEFKSNLATRDTITVYCPWGYSSKECICTCSPTRSRLTRRILVHDYVMIAVSVIRAHTWYIRFLYCIFFFNQFEIGLNETHFPWFTTNFMKIFRACIKCIYVIRKKNRKTSICSSNNFFFFLIKPFGWFLILFN